MARRRRPGDDEPTLFDLPLTDPGEPEPEAEPLREEAPAEPEEGEAGGGAADERAGGPEDPEDERAAVGAGPASERPRRREPSEPLPTGERPPPLSLRFLAGLADLAVHLALAVALLFGARLLGVSAGFSDWLPVALFLLVFSFLYTVVPLAFWGRTPGMAWAGVEARAGDGGSLTLGQTVRRWLGGLLTVALLGLPTLLAAGGGGSLADRLSDSATRPVE